MIGGLVAALNALLGVPPPSPWISVGPVVGIPVHVDCEPADLEAWSESVFLLPGEAIQPRATHSLSSAITRYKILEHASFDQEPAVAQRASPCHICADVIEEGDEIMAVPLCG